MGQQERTEVVNLHGDVETVVCVLIFSRLGAGVVDEDVQSFFRFVDLFGEFADWLQGGQVEVSGGDVGVVGHGDDFVFGFGGVFAVGYDDAAAAGGEEEGGFEADTWKLKKYNIYFWKKKIILIFRVMVFKFSRLDA